MQKIENRGITIGPEDGQPLRSGNYLYWNPQFANIVREHLSDFLPQADEAGAGSALFHKRERGRELCATSSSFLDPAAKIPASAVGALVAAIDRMHAKASDPSTSPDAAAFIRGFSLPDPAEMPEAWRIPAGSRGPLILWGWKKNGSKGSTFLPLTPTSAKWPDAAARRDLRLLLQGNKRLGTSVFYSWPWRVFGAAALAALLALLAFLLVNKCGCDGSGSEPKPDNPTQHEEPIAPSPTNGVASVVESTNHAYRVSLASESERDGRFLPVFHLEPPDNEAIDAKWVDWELDGVDAGRGFEEAVGDKNFHAWNPENGFGSNETHRVGAILTQDNGTNELHRIHALPFEWKKGEVKSDGDGDDHGGGGEDHGGCDDPKGGGDHGGGDPDGGDDHKGGDGDHGGDDDHKGGDDPKGDGDDPKGDSDYPKGDSDYPKGGEKPQPPAVDYCPIHPDSALVEGTCRVRCPICGKHLEKDGGKRCPNTCDKHPDTHLDKGICPKCHPGGGMETVEDWVNLLGEQERDGRLYPVFSVSTRIQTQTKREEWTLDGADAGEGSTNEKREWVWSPPNGFGPGETHEIGAVSTKMIDGKVRKIKAKPYVWTHNPPPPEDVKRNIVGCGSRLDEDSNREYFLIRLFSNPEDHRAEVESWTADLEGMEIPCSKDTEFSNAMRLYKTGIPRDGVVTVKASVLIAKTLRREMSAAFLFKAGMLESDGVDDTGRMDTVTTLYTVCGPSVFFCDVPGRGSGTAFAVTKRDLITNEHVIHGHRTAILCKEDGTRISAKIVLSDETHDLAWLRIENPVLNPLEIDGDQSVLEAIVKDVNERGVESSADVIAFGYPYWAKDQDPSKDQIPTMSRTVGKIRAFTQDGMIAHSALTTHGNSGGPLFAVNGTIIGVNTQIGFQDKQGSELLGQISKSIPASVIPRVFPNLFSGE